MAFEKARCGTRLVVREYPRCRGGNIGHRIRRRQSRRVREVPSAEANRACLDVDCSHGNDPKVRIAHGIIRRANSLRHLEAFRL
jgi:hypothetical protein